jgi:hypothetical protein
MISTRGRRMRERKVLSMANAAMLMVLPGADFTHLSLKPAASKNSASRRRVSAD